MPKKKPPRRRPLTPAQMGRLSRAKLTKKQRSESARAAARARWARVAGTPSAIATVPTP